MFILIPEFIPHQCDRMDRGWYFGHPSSSGKKVYTRSTNADIPSGPSQQEQIQTIHGQSCKEFTRKEATARTALNSQILDRTERSVKMCLFSLTMRYFQAYNSFKKQKPILSGDYDLIRGSKQLTLSLERLAIEKEELCARKRDEALKKANEAARRGASRIQQRREYELSTKVSSKTLHAI